MYAALGRAPEIEYVANAEVLRDTYQYFTQAEVANLQRAGYNAGFAPLEDSVRRYVDRLPRPRRPVPLSMLDFEARLQNIGQQTVLCIGDLMLDDFVYGEVGRISPEAPAPVLAVKRNELAIGGAGNVARNIASLGARCIFVGLVGADDAARDVIARLQADPLIEPSLVIDPTRPTTRKVRFVSEHFPRICCAPTGSRRVRSAPPWRARSSRARSLRCRGPAPSCSRTMPRACSTPRVIAEVIGAANEAGIP